MTTNPRHSWPERSVIGSTASPFLVAAAVVLGIAESDHGPAVVSKLFRHAAAPPPVGLPALHRALRGCSASVPVAAVDDDGDEGDRTAQLVSKMSSHPRQIAADDDSDKHQRPFRIHRSPPAYYCPSLPNVIHAL
jgi:hypothetical protein